MKNGRTILLWLCLTLALAGVVEAQEWRTIVPVKSTRTDVERLLGPRERSYGLIYELETGNLSIEYSTGLCGGDKREGWNVPEDTVISYKFSAKVKQRLADLKLDGEKFKKVKDTHVGVVDYYINDEEGIMYQVQDGEVDYVEYYPPQSYKYLYCGDSSANLLGGKKTSP
jgi:hypothetical protein